MWWFSHHNFRKLRAGVLEPNHMRNESKLVSSNPKFANEGAAKLGELRIRHTR